MKYLNTQKLAQAKKFNSTFESYDTTKVRESKIIPSLTKTLPNYGKRLTKTVADLESAIKLSGLKNGMTISFHHHFRHGDETVELVLNVIKKLKIKNLTISASSFTRAHDCLIDFIKDGTVIGLEGSALRGHLGDAISEGILKKPVILRGHGCRTRAIACGESKIDVAFLAASASDHMGNANGMYGASACGSLGYAMVDAKYADKVIIITDNIVPFPNSPASIRQEQVDYVVKVDRLGDPKKIAMGEIHTTFNAKELAIARNMFKVIANTEWFKEGFSFQTGAGGAPQASLIYLREAMLAKNIKASFFLGGIINDEVNMLKEGLVHKLIDTQCFDLGSIKSMRDDLGHIEVSASEYANPNLKGSYIDVLDYGILGALEIDTNFNVNVITGADGYIRGAIGGHQDVAFGAKVSIVGIPLIRGRISSVVEKLQTNITPGDIVDVVVTEIGIAVNPKRQDIIKQLKQANIPLMTLEDFKKQAQEIIGTASPIEYDTNHPIAFVEYRDGSIIDVIYKVKPYNLK